MNEPEISLVQNLYTRFVLCLQLSLRIKASMGQSQGAVNTAHLLEAPLATVAEDLSSDEEEAF